ncbi:MAG TPA: hypothetical protein VFC51_19650 [Chloroflexota bacterium]|nr:hypothetical protein [Chloroflexota bacterium]
MSDIHERAARELRAVVDRFAAGEAEVVRAYAQAPHSMEENVDVLLRQMGREVQRKKWMDRFHDLAAEMERSVDRHTYAEILEQMSEETAHYVLLADLVEELIGRKLTPDEALKYEVFTRYEVGRPFEQTYHPLLPEANRLIDVAWEAVQALGPDRCRHLIHLAEGGGGGAFVEALRLHGDPFRDGLARAMRRIVHDEMGHGPARIDGYARDWVHTEDELAQDVHWLSAYMAQHLRVRNEIWRTPLSEERLAAIDRGDTAPFDPTVESVAVGV